MKNLRNLSQVKLCFIVVLCAALSGCSDNLYDVAESATELKEQGNEGKLLSTHFSALKKEIIPPVILKGQTVSLPDILEAKNFSAVHLRDSTWADGSGKSSFYESGDMVVTPVNASYIYPGALLRASSIATDQFYPFTGYERAPISVQLSFPSSLSIGSHPTPSLSNSRIFLRDALMAPDFSGQSIQDFTSRVSYISHYNEVKLAYGYNVNETRLFSSTNSSFDYNAFNTRYATKLTVTYTVKNFTYSMHDPVEGELIDLSTITPDVFDGLSPIFINSVTYGRFGLLVIETNSEAAQMRSVFEKTVKKIFKQTTESFTQEEINLFNSCRITIHLLGSTMGESVTQLLISPDPEAISSFIGENVGVFTATDPGVPISFTAKYLRDNTPFKTIFKLDF